MRFRRPRAHPEREAARAKASGLDITGLLDIATEAIEAPETTADSR